MAIASKEYKIQHRCPLLRGKTRSEEQDILRQQQPQESQEEDMDTPGNLRELKKLWCRRRSNAYLNNREAGIGLVEPVPAGKG